MNSNIYQICSKTKCRGERSTAFISLRQLCSTVYFIFGLFFCDVFVGTEFSNGGGYNKLDEERETTMMLTIIIIMMADALDDDDRRKWIFQPSQKMNGLKFF